VDRSRMAHTKTAPFVRMSRCLNPGNRAATSGLPQCVGSGHNRGGCFGSIDDCCAIDGVAKLDAAAPTAKAEPKPRRLKPSSICFGLTMVGHVSLIGVFRKR